MTARDLSRFVAAPSILDLLAEDAGVSPLFAAAICRVGSERHREVMAEELACQRDDVRRERDERGE